MLKHFSGHIGRFHVENVVHQCRVIFTIFLTQRIGLQRKGMLRDFVRQFVASGKDVVVVLRGSYSNVITDFSADLSIFDGNGSTNTFTLVVKISGFRILRVGFIVNERTLFCPCNRCLERHDHERLFRIGDGVILSTIGTTGQGSNSRSCDSIDFSAESGNL